MRTLSRRYRLVPEMVVSVPKGLFTHVGIVSHRSYGGMPLIFASSPQTNGADEVTWWEFSGGQPVKIEGYPRDLPPGEVLRRAQWLVRRLPYDAGTQNCEHFVTRCLGYEPFSPQVQKWITLGAIVFGVVALAKAT
jgi:hypothetical protein